MLRPRRPLVVMAAISVVALAIIALVDLLTPVPPTEHLHRLRLELRALRTAADSCRAALAREQAELRASDARLDSLRRAIRFYESLDPRGVPADSYDIYMNAFEAYNAGVPGRAAAGDTLAAHWRACTEIVVRHNAIADSARAVARQLGLIPAEDAPPGR